MPKSLLAGALLLVVVGCKSQLGTPDASMPRAPAPFEPLGASDEASDAGADDRDAIFRVAPFTPGGPSLPAAATRVELHGEHIGAIPTEGALLLVAVEDTYLVQAAALLAQLDDTGREVWLKHPDVDFAYRLTLRDEPTFQQWLEEPVPGKLRVIQRADGFELQTNMGKLPGRDLNGPTVPVRGGKMDLPTFRRGLIRIKNRFRDAPDFCLMPSFGMPLGDSARALAANWPAPDDAIFGSVCLVYPRPKVRDAGR